MQNEAKLIALLGLAQKAGKLASGDIAVERAIQSGKTKLLLIATDASAATKKGYLDMAAFYNIDCYEVLSKDRLGNAIGKPQRAALAFLDQGFSVAAKKLLIIE